ncbi:hypothetical protein [Streptomyces olivochromogenes]|uniref:hypothetical protein n=1 Tax=Streptomyces olivochromogenes TaxID=1963 RepID=UPI0036A18AD6
MRALPARRLASSVLCASLLLGISGPVALAADRDSARGHTHAAAPVPGADALLAQVKALGGIAGVLAPVTDLLDAALKAENGQLSADQAAKLAQAVKDAIAKAAAAAPVPPATTTPALPTLPTLPAVPTLPSVKKSAGAQDDSAVAGDQDNKAPRDKGSRALTARDLAGDALTALQKAVDTLVAAVTSGDATKVVPAATAVLTGLVNFVVAVVLGGGLPAANLPGLPPLPALPTPALPLPALPTPALPTPALPTPALPTPALPSLPAV